MNRTDMNKLLKAALIILTVCFVSCRHKELYDEKIFAADVRVVFDWTQSPDAHVETVCIFFQWMVERPCYMSLPICREEKSPYR